MWRLFPFLFVALTAHAQPTPVSLNDCYRLARDHLESIRIREEEIRAAEGRYGQALSGVLPRLKVLGSERIQDTSGVAVGGDIGATFVRRSTPEVTVNLTQPLFQGLRELTALRAASADRKRSEYNYERALQLLVGEVATIFLSVLRSERDLEILHSQQEVLGRRLRELETRVRLGKSREGERITTKTEGALLEAEVARARGEGGSAREALTFLTGVPTDQPLAEPVPPGDPGPLEDYLAQASRRPDRLAGEEAARLAKARVSYERGSYLPEIDLEANYYPYRVGFYDPIDWDLMLTLEVPLFSGGETRGRVREAKARRRQATLAREETHRRAELEVRQAYRELTAARERLDALRDASMTAEKNYATLLGEYQLGLVSNLDVLQGLRDWQGIRRGLNETHHDWLLKDTLLKIAAGEGLPP